MTKICGSFIASSASDLSRKVPNEMLYQIKLSGCFQPSCTWCAIATTEGWKCKEIFYLFILQITCKNNLCLLWHIEREFTVCYIFSEWLWIWYNKNLILKYLKPVGVNRVTFLFPVWIHYFNPCRIHICGSNVPCMASAEKTFIKTFAKEIWLFRLQWLYCWESSCISGKNHAS